MAILLSDGVLVETDGGCRPSPEANNWLRRQLVETDPHAFQHRQTVSVADGRILNLAESPLARLAVPSSGEVEPFLSPHQVEAGERVRRLAERAQLQPRVTMSYHPAHMAQGGNRSGAPEIGDLAIDARRQLDEIARVLPRDCAGVVLDVCGLLKGLQVVESERRWPRRSAKLVLRIALEQLSVHFGLAAVAVGPDLRRQRAWMAEGARPAMSAMRED